MKEIIEIFKAILFGIVEGITEWLPVSSTGHMIILDELVSLKVSESFWELFLVVIQLGAIIAVPILFFDKLNPFSKAVNQDGVRSNRVLSLWGKVIVGVIPAGILGVAFDDMLDKYLYNFWVVAIALIVYGIAFILVERLKAKNGGEYRVNDVFDLSYRDAITIGCFQMLSLIPGTSRSGSTILGGMLTGVSRTAASEFSFFMAIPILLGASLLKIVKFLMDGFVPTAFELCILGVGMAVSFIVSLIAIRFLMSFVKRHSFAPFGVYRIILGIAVLGYFLVF